MARIRTIKPEFWTDEKIVQLPYPVRLLFVGMWNFADDDGFVPFEPARLKMQILPADNEDIDELIDYLVCSGLVEIFESATGNQALKIPNFSNHQVISHKTPSKFSPEFSRKLRIHDAVRREIAVKYGCAPGSESTANCYYCGSEGKIIWSKTASGRPGAWVVFAGLEIDHFVSEISGGKGENANLVLACRPCNRAKKDGLAMDSFKVKSRKNFRKIPEDSSLNGMEGNGKELKGMEVKVNPIPKAADALSANGGKTVQTWEAYSLAYKQRYGADPVRNAKSNGQLGRLVDQLGSEESPLVAAFYLEHNGGLYVSSGHCIDLLLRDCSKLRTEMVTGRKITRLEVKSLEQRDSLREQADRVGRLLENKA